MVTPNARRQTHTHLCKLLFDVVAQLWVVGKEKLTDGVLASGWQLGKAVVLDNAHEKVVGDGTQDARAIACGGDGG